MAFPFVICRRWPLHGHFSDWPAANLSFQARVSLLMDTNLLDVKFSQIGAPLKVAKKPRKNNLVKFVVSAELWYSSIPREMHKELCVALPSPRRSL